MSAHLRERVVNLSVWRDDLCVGTVRLLPDEAAALVTGLTEGLAQLSEWPAPAPAQVEALEDRMARLEARIAEPAWRSAATRTVRTARDAVAARLRPVRP